MQWRIQKRQKMFIGDPKPLGVTTKQCQTPPIKIWTTPDCAGRRLHPGSNNFQSVWFYRLTFLVTGRMVAGCDRASPGSWSVRDRSRYTYLWRLSHRQFLQTGGASSLNTESLSDFYKNRSSGVVPQKSFYKNHFKAGCGIEFVRRVKWIAVDGKMEFFLANSVGTVAITNSRITLSVLQLYLPS